MIKKIVIYGVLAFAVYWGLNFYSTYTFAEKVSACGRRVGLPSEYASTRDKFLASAKAWRCVKQDQNFLESFIFKIPDSWINPPRPYVDPPFTAEELAGEFGANEAISSDIRALAEIYRRDGNRFNRIVGLLVVGDHTKLGIREINQRYGEVSRELKSIADRFSAVRLKTSEVNELHQTFVKSLRRLASDGQELEFLFISVNRDIEESDAILALPKSAIAENKGRLLGIRDRLTRAEAQIENRLEVMKQNGRTAMQTLDELEALASKHGASLSPLRSNN